MPRQRTQMLFLAAETGREVEGNFVAVVRAELELANGFEVANPVGAVGLDGEVAAHAGLSDAHR
eukprot:6097573-Prymnesium_polylepis.1